MKKKHIIVLLLALMLLVFSVCYFSKQQMRPQAVAIGFYNLENLFDTINDVGLLLSEEFTPESEKQWTSSRYHDKLVNLAFVISKMATDTVPDGLALLGVCEVENRGVLDDLVRQPSIKGRNYQIVHYDSPDERGIDVGLLYNPRYFRVTNSKTYKLTLADDSAFLSRDQLVVSGYLEDELYHILVNHWPSRRGGEEQSRPKRNAAGDLSRYIVDSLVALDVNANILVMGDMNDDPVNESIIEHLGAKHDPRKLAEGDLFNPMHQIYSNGEGTLKFKGEWNLFDMIIVSSGILHGEDSEFKFAKAEIFNEDFLKQKGGAYEGYPNRTYGGKKYLGGYSDHFPVYVILTKNTGQ
ncbi:MAG: endonuclease/exonuclease/phosphatase family protein [Bacteroidales bacterium]